SGHRAHMQPEIGLVEETMAGSFRQRDGLLDDRRFRQYRWRHHRGGLRRRHGWFDDRGFGQHRRRYCSSFWRRSSRLGGWRGGYKICRGLAKGSARKGQQQRKEAKDRIQTQESLPGRLKLAGVEPFWLD